ncbi:MAG: NRAMP family divalent metal transporter [Gemmatimonadaceae bacterium]
MSQKVTEVALGVITGIGGFLEVGSLATSVQGGSEFGFQLGWAVLLGSVSLMILMEASGRLAAVSDRTLIDQLRERFGIRFFLLPLAVGFVVSLLVLASEIGGVSLALQMATGIRFQLWALPVAFLAWILLWRGTFSIVENGAAIFGLVSIVFAVAAAALHPRWMSVAAGLLPTRPAHDTARYWYLAVSILGASISPYLYAFYSSGAIEDGWTTEHLGVNRITAFLGNLFGGGLALMVIVVAAMVFLPRHIHVDAYEQTALVLTPALSHPGFVFFLATLAITCFGTTLEIALAIAYMLAQGLGWPWSENMRPSADSRFSVSYTLVLIVAAIPVLLGVDILGLTNISMVLTAASLPATVVPMVVLMNDRDVMGKSVNGVVANVALVLLAVLSCAILLAAIPLQLLGGS